MINRARVNNRETAMPVVHTYSALTEGPAYNDAVRRMFELRDMLPYEDRKLWMKIKDRSRCGLTPTLFQLQAEIAELDAYTDLLANQQDEERNRKARAARKTRERTGTGIVLISIALVVVGLIYIVLT